MPNEYDKEDNMEIYTPEVGNSEEFGLDETTTSYSPRLNALKEGEVINVKLNERAIKWRISHDLYKDFRSGVRELFQNEARACRQARNKYNAKSRIEIKIDTDTREFSIHGIDSLGISEAVFDKVLRVLGVSGNTDGGNEVGQFGMGFASYTTLSDIVKVETWFRDNRKNNTEQRYAFIGDNGIDFKILPEPEMDTYGTRLSLTYNDGVDVSGIIDMLNECAKFCGVPVVLIVESDWSEYHSKGKQGIYELETFKNLLDCLETQLAYKENVYKEDGSIDWKMSRIRFYKKVHINNDDYEFVGLIAMRDENSYTTFVHGTMNYHLLATVPIEINFSPHGQWSSYALNIKNERKFMPTADRDRLTKEAEQNIQKMSDEEILKYFNEYKLESIDDYNKTIDKPMYNEYYNFENLIEKDIFTETQTVLNTLGGYFTTSTGNSKTLKYMMGTNKNLICLKALNSDYMARLHTVFPLDETIIFRYKRNDERSDDDGEERYNKNLDLLEKAGVIMGEQYIKVNKIRPLTKKEKKNGRLIANSAKPIRLFNSGYRRRHKDNELFGNATNYGHAYQSVTIGEVNKNIHDKMIIFDLKDKNLWEEVKRNLWNSESQYVLMKNIKGLDTDKIQFYRDWLNNQKDKTIHFIKESSIDINKLDKELNYYVIEGKVGSIKTMINDKEFEGFNNVIIYENPEELFEICEAGRSIGLSISTRNRYGESMEELIKKSSGIDEEYTFYCDENTKKEIYSELPDYKNKISNELFQLMIRSVSSKPYEYHEIKEIIDKIIEDKKD